MLQAHGTDAQPIVSPVRKFANKKSLEMVVYDMLDKGMKI
jgi:hypothetical protein